MLFNMKNTTGKKIKVVDAVGKEVQFVQSYDTVTRNAVIAVTNGTLNEKGHPNFIVHRNKEGINTVLKTKVSLRGSKIFVDGVEY